MLWNLLVKDLHRVWRNPWPCLINLALPLCITGLIGLAFGPSSQGASLGRIKLAIVDEDDSVVSRFLRGAASQGNSAKYLEARFLERDKAIQQINRNEISAVVIIPKDFTRGYLTGREAVALELVKNPAQAIYPAIVEEFLEVAVTSLNALARNLHSDFPEWLQVLEKSGRPDLVTASQLMLRLGDKFNRLEKFLFPPLVTYFQATRPKETSSGPGFNLFAYMLPGLAAMFLLLLADISIRDLYREMQARTFDRFRTLQPHVFPFIFSKVLLAMAVVSLGSAILFLGGGAIFRVHWERPLPMLLVVVAYALFASGFMSAIAALARSERRAEVLNNSIVLLLAFAGGSFFPARQLPTFLRDGISPLMPNYWFIEAIRSLQAGDAEMPWTLSAVRLTIFGLALIALASWLLQRALSKGARA